MTQKINKQFNIYSISDKDVLKKLIAELLYKNEIKALRQLLKNNPYAIQLKPRELNKELKPQGYKFSSRRTNLILMIDNHNSVKDKNLSIINNVYKIM